MTGIELRRPLLSYRLEFLHIPKTGGSAIKQALAHAPTVLAGRVVTHGHGVRLADIPQGSLVGLVVRDPLSRFVSAFYSRQRQGKPRYHSPWSVLEQQVFAVFSTPRALAEALADPAHVEHLLAQQAMSGIGHLRPLSYWLGSEYELRRRLPDLCFVGFQESLTADFETFKCLLGAPPHWCLPEDDFGAHRNPASLDVSLSPQARQCLAAWYQADFDLINLLRTHAGQLSATRNRSEAFMSQTQNGMNIDQQTAGQLSDHSTARSVVTVLGSGRSGTSLLMQVLCELGMSAGDNPLLTASGANPEGFFEDVEIVAAHKRLHSKLGSDGCFPLPPNWLKTPAAQETRKRLSLLVAGRVEAAGNRLWGFKDPRTADFIELWMRLFNAPGLKPLYILALRDPASVMASLRSQGQRADAVNETLWLRRNLETLHYTGGNCFIVHYEDWFTRPQALIRELLEYSGLATGFSGDIDQVVARVVKAQLNRAPHQYPDIELHNPCVSELYDVLRNYRGAEFDQAALMARVEYLRKIMSGFDAAATAQLRKQNRGPARSVEHEVLVAENSRLLLELTAITREAEGLRASLYGTHPPAPPKAADVAEVPAKNQSIQVKRLQRDLKSVRESFAFRSGSILVVAMKRPGLNTLKAPFRLLKLYREFRSAHRAGKR